MSATPDRAPPAMIVMLRKPDAATLERLDAAGYEITTVYVGRKARTAWMHESAWPEITDEDLAEMFRDTCTPPSPERLAALSTLPFDWRPPEGEIDDDILD
jgi:hypothetical protein